MLLALAVLSVAAGAKTFVEIAEYGADLPVWLLAELAVCSWWGTPGIEGRLHLVRDVAFNEDHHRARTGNAPQNLAVLRNTAITLHRQNAATGIQPAPRATRRRPERLLDLLPETT